MTLVQVITNTNTNLPSIALNMIYVVEKCLFLQCKDCYLCPSKILVAHGYYQCPYSMDHQGPRDNSATCLWKE